MMSESVLENGFEEGYQLSVSFVEIYGGKILDLLSDRKHVRLFEDLDGVAQLYGQKEAYIKDLDSLQNFIDIGIDARTVGATEANSESSRSHAIFQLSIWKPDSSLYGKFAIADLAGSERGVDMGPNIDKKARMEGSEINKSLLALKECIRALHLKRSRQDTGYIHIPFRDSKLTTILKDSFEGKNSHTAMMCMISPGASCSEQSLNTLRYAYRVKEMKDTIPDDVSQKPAILVKRNSLPKITVAVDQLPATLDKGAPDIQQNKTEPEDLFKIEPPLKITEQLAEATENNQVRSDDQQEQGQTLSDEQLFEEHLKCMTLNTNISKKERLLITKINDPDQAGDLKEYVKETLELVKKRIDLYKSLQSKLEAFQR